MSQPTTIQITLKDEKLLSNLIIDNIPACNELIQKAKGGDFNSICEIADEYYTRKQYEKAMLWYKIAATAGHPYSQYKLGYMYSYAKGVPKDYKMAMQWFLEGHVNGVAAATRYVGIMYTFGEGVDKNYDIALKYHLEAAEKHDGVAEYMVGYHYENGLGITENKERALKWYIRSAVRYSKAEEAIKRLNQAGIYLNDRPKYLQLVKEVEKKDKHTNTIKVKLQIREQEVLEAQERIKAKDKVQLRNNQSNAEESVNSINPTQTESKERPFEEIELDTFLPSNQPIPTKSTSPPQQDKDVASKSSNETRPKKNRALKKVLIAMSCGIAAFFI